MRNHMWDFQPPDKLLSEDLHPPNFHLIRFLCSCKCGIIVMWLYLCSTSFFIIIIWAHHNSPWKWIPLHLCCQRGALNSGHTLSPCSPFGFWCFTKLDQALINFLLCSPSSARPPWNCWNCCHLFHFQCQLSSLTLMIWWPMMVSRPALLPSPSRGLPSTRESSDQSPV